MRIKSKCARTTIPSFFYSTNDWSNTVHKCIMCGPPLRWSYGRAPTQNLDCFKGKKGVLLFSYWNINGKQQCIQWSQGCQRQFKITSASHKGPLGALWTPYPRKSWDHISPPLKAWLCNSCFVIAFSVVESVTLYEPESGWQNGNGRWNTGPSSAGIYFLNYSAVWRRMKLSTVGISLSVQ